MAYRKKFVNEKKIMYGLRIPNLYVKNMHHMEWGKIWKVHRMCLH